MNDQATWTIVKGLENLGRIESRHGERVSKSRLMANRYQAISARFFAYAESAPNQEMERLDLLEAKNFRDLADMEEGFVTSGLRRLVEIDRLKQQMLTLFDEWNAVSKPQRGERMQPTAQAVGRIGK
jgi:hypothetical protein